MRTKMCFGWLIVLTGIADTGIEDNVINENTQK